MAEGKTKEIIVEMAESGDMRADALKEVTILENNSYLSGKIRF